METKYLLAQQWVRQAGAVLRERLGQELLVEEKADFRDLVTNLDRDIQEFLTKEIHSHYPSDTVMGEESVEQPAYDEGAVWIVDPIDGTTNLIVQQADFAVLLAYFEEGIGQFGLLYDVMQDRLIHGGVSFPVCLNDQPLHSPLLPSLQRSLLGLNATLYASNYGGLADLADQTLGTRSVGSAGIGFSHVLTGRLLAYASYLSPWDYAAALVVAPLLGYTLQTLSGDVPRFSGREHVILLPLAHKEEIQGYLDKCSYQENL